MRGSVSRDSPDSLYSPGLRRWDGRARVTNKWNTLNCDRELCYANGDCLVCLRAPGPNGIGPSFRLHSSHLALKGLRCLVDLSVEGSGPARAPKKLAPARELYLPAPEGLNKSQTIDYHLDTRNLFAWLYNIPLTGRSLGRSIVGLLTRLNVYRPGQAEKNRDAVLSYLEFQGYYDFRECADHALAILHFAEVFEMESIWIDAFSHCVGLHSVLDNSPEFEATSRTTRGLIVKARIEMDVRLESVSRSVADFFEKDLSATHLGLPPAARDHLDRFRSFLIGYYIKKFGFWPPHGLEEGPQRQTNLYRSMYSDFSSLYHHMVDSASSPSISDNKTPDGGLCCLQILLELDKRHRYESLPHPLPLIPSLNMEAVQPGNVIGGRMSFNPIRRWKADKELRFAASVQALIDSSNREIPISNHPLVQQFERFERESLCDHEEGLSLGDGRKVRWILIYTVLQTLISVIYAPKQVRDPEGLSYSLCARRPKILPWQMGRTQLTEATKSRTKNGRVELEPDIKYLPQVSSTSLPARIRGDDGRATKTLAPTKSNVSVKSRASDTGSLRGFLTRRRPTSLKSTRVSRPPHCEIIVPGYGNGLSETTRLETVAGEASTDAPGPLADGPYLSTAQVSRESSKSSGYSRCTDESGERDEVGDMDHLSVDGADEPAADGSCPIEDEKNATDTVRFDTTTWDAVLGALARA